MKTIPLNQYPQLSDHNGWSILDKYPCNPKYLDVIQAVMKKALNNHSRTLVVRVDLHTPISACIDSRVISRFFDSLKAKIKARERKNKRNGVRVHKSEMEYVWCREFGVNNNVHYHLGIFLNGDAFNGLGNYRTVEDNLAGMIYCAWASAMKCDVEDVFTLVHFPKSEPFYLLNVLWESFIYKFNCVFNRLSYLAKFESKIYGSGKRNFGSSQK